MKQLLADASIWSGAVIGLLTILDWLISDSQKKYLKRKAEDFWIWLAEQHSGKFTHIVLQRRFQAFAVGFAIFVILMFCFGLALVSGGEIKVDQTLPAFLGNYFVAFGFGFPIPWLDGIVLMISGYTAFRLLVPRVISWITRPNHVAAFVVRSVVSWISLQISSTLAWFVLFLLLGLPIILVLGWVGLDIKIAYTISGAITALLTAPFIISSVVMMCLSLLSACWLILTAFLMAFFRVFQFILYRIIESSKGIVLGLSGLLVGIGAIVSAIK